LTGSIPYVIIIEVYTETERLSLTQAYEKGILDKDDLTEIYLHHRSENDFWYRTRDAQFGYRDDRDFINNAPHFEAPIVDGIEYPTLDPETEKKIKAAYSKTFGRKYPIEDITTDLYGGCYNGAQVVFMRISNSEYLQDHEYGFDEKFNVTLFGMQYSLPTDHLYYIVVYADTRMLTLRQACQLAYLDYEDLKQIYTYHVNAFAKEYANLG